MASKVTDLVTYEDSQYSLADLAHYMDDESREALHSDAFTTDDDRGAQEWWDEYVRRYPEDAAYCAEVAPRVHRDRS